MKKEIIAKQSLIARPCFVGRGYSNFTVTGMLIKYRLFGLTWYRIKIFKPHVSGVYDGCFTTRAKLKLYADDIKTHLKQKLFEHKMGIINASRNFINYGNPNN